MLEERGVVGLTGRDQHHQRSPGAVDEMVDLAGQPAPGTANAVVRRLDAADCCNSTQPPVWRVTLVACWCARAIVESTATAQSMASAASAALSNRASTASQVPSALMRRCQAPNRLPRPEHLGHITPGDPASVAIDDALDHLAGIPERPALLTRTHRQKTRRSTPTEHRKATENATYPKPQVQRQKHLSDTP